MILQPVLPVMTPDNRILGVVRIVPTVFLGTETSVVSDGNNYQVQKTTYKRADGVVVEFLSIPVSFTEERQEAHQHIRGFVGISDVFYNNNWIQIANITQSPERSRSHVEAFLQKTDYGVM